MKCEKNLRGKVYESIDELPIYNWWKIHETSEYSMLLCDKTEVNKYVRIVLKKKWETVYDGYIKRFGFAPDMMDIHKKRVKIAKLKVSRMVTKDRKLNTPIAIAEHELKELLRIQSEKQGADFFEIKAMIEEERKMPIDHMKVTVAEFFTYLEILKKKKSNGRG